MVPILLTALLACFASLVVGQAALRVAGATEWSWLAPPVGISLLMLVALPATHVPGRCTTVAALIAALTLAAAVWCLRDPAHRPPPTGLLAALPVAGMTLLPFLSAGHAGTLGTSLNNDMAPHLAIVEAYLSSAVASIAPLPSDYPLGPHAMVAILAKGLGIRADEAFAGWTMALPILTAWTALALVRRATWLGQVATATVVGMPFLVAAYYGEGAFKEVLQADLVLAIALLLAGCGPAMGRGRWVPLAVLTSGTVLVYSLTGLPWPLAFLGIYLAGEASTRVARRGVRGAWRELRARRIEIAVGSVLAVALLIPQLPRIHNYVSARGSVNGTGIDKGALGNLVGALPGWEAFGVWNNPDFRFPATPAFTGGMWTALVLALALLGVLWYFQRGRWMLPAAAGAALLIWAVSDRSQSPYVAAKALVIASPLLLALAVGPLVERGARRPPWWTLAPLLVLVLVLRVGLSDVRALHISPVGPTDHMRELRDLRPLLHGQPTLFLGNDDYVVSELAGVPVGTPVINATQTLTLRPQKQWTFGTPLDFDSVETAALNTYAWVITTRDAAGSEPPRQFRLVKATRSFALWRRVAHVPPREVLAEGDASGAVLRCSTPTERALVRRNGIAAVREAPVAVPAPGVGPGSSASAQLSLHAGTWELASTYTSPRPVTVTAPGLRTTLPANLDRVGPRWRIGRIVVRDRRPLTISFQTTKGRLTPRSAIAVMSTVVATPVAPDRIVPLRSACGRYVDWYQTAS